MGMFGHINDSVPSIEDAKPAYFAAAGQLGLKIDKFEQIDGQWEMGNIIYKMEVAVEGVINSTSCSHIESLRLHKTKNGWDVELPMFSICGIRTNNLHFESLPFVINRKTKS
jgi:hypothetical protein